MRVLLRVLTPLWFLLVASSLACTPHWNEVKSDVGLFEAEIEGPVECYQDSLATDHGALDLPGFVGGSRHIGKRREPVRVITSVQYANVSRWKEGDREALLRLVLEEKARVYAGVPFQGRVVARSAFRDQACEGLAMEMSMEYVSLLARACTSGDWLYLRVISGKKDEVEGAIGARFFGSFRIVDPPRSRP